MISSMQADSPVQYFHQPWEQHKDSPLIDKSLARAIGRSFIKTIDAEWESYQDRGAKAIARNNKPSRRIENLRQLKERQALLDKLMGGLLPVSSVHVNAKSKAASLTMGLRTYSPLQAQPTLHFLKVHLWLLFMPGKLSEYEIPVCVSTHAIERVIQRNGLVDLPIRKIDIEAVMAEFSDVLPLATLSIKAIKELARLSGDDVAKDLTLLLPSANGLFLGSWCDELKSILIKTFVDARKFNEAQVQAVKEIRCIAEAEIGPALIDTLAPGWIQFGANPIHDQLTKAWQHFAWRFDLDRLHPGMSDAAWLHSH